MAQLFNRLLLATEHSDFDTGAEALAFALARRCQLPLATVMPLVSNPEYEALAPQIAARAEREAAARIAQLREQAAASGVAIDLRLRRGEEPYEEIVQEALQQGNDLIIIRRRGKRGFLANLLVGEMVSKVVAHAPCDVLIVPREARMWQERVLAAAEPTAQGRQVVATAAAVAAECCLPLHVVIVIASAEERPKSEAFLREALELAQRRGVTVQGEVRMGKPFTEILAAGVGCRADLIVMGSRSDNRIGRALVGGVAQKVMGLAEIPVMVLNLH
jgi:nucleotide-binding universal stress UspA family protein